MLHIFGAMPQKQDAESDTEQITTQPKNQQQSTQATT
jgi:hypothetical protein